MFVVFALLFPIRKFDSHLASKLLRSRTLRSPSLFFLEIKKVKPLRLRSPPPGRSEIDEERSSIAEAWCSRSVWPNSVLPAQRRTLNHIIMAFTVVFVGEQRRDTYYRNDPSEYDLEVGWCRAPDYMCSPVREHLWVVERQVASAVVMATQSRFELRSWETKSKVRCTHGAVHMAHVNLFSLFETRTWQKKTGVGVAIVTHTNAWCAVFLMIFLFGIIFSKTSRGLLLFFFCFFSPFQIFIRHSLFVCFRCVHSSTLVCFALAGSWTRFFTF